MNIEVINSLFTTCKVSNFLVSARLIIGQNAVESEKIIWRYLFWMVENNFQYGVCRKKASEVVDYCHQFINAYQQGYQQG